MPTGIILKSASHEASDEVREKNVRAAIEDAGYEVVQSETPAEPKRDDFKTDEEFETAHVEWQDKQEEKEVEEFEEEEEKPKVAAAPKKSRRERAVERATADLKRERDDLRAQVEALKSKTKEEPPKETIKPKHTDFDNDEAYDDALVKWGNDKYEREKIAKDAEAAKRASFETNLRNYSAQVEEVKERYEDWDEVVNQDIHIGTAVQVAVLELENGAEVIYYLGRHPAYAAKLGEMSEPSAVMEVGRLSARLTTGAPAPGEANGEARMKPKPKVPAPVRTVNTAGSSTALTFAEIAAKPNYPGKAKDLRRAMSADQ